MGEQYLPKKKAEIFNDMITPALTHFNCAAWAN
jgi:hypothetical protein